MKQLPLIVAILTLSASHIAFADTPPDSSTTNALAAGHSQHGEAFNDGPRQAPYLMGGTGKISFSIATDSKKAKQFFLQGLGQLHGFWYFESERSFRQVAFLLLFQLGTLTFSCQLSRLSISFDRRRSLMRKSCHT